MAVSHFYGVYAPSEYFPVVGDVKLLERFGSMMQVDRQELSVHEDQVTQAKAGAFFKFLEGSCATGLVGGAYSSLLVQHPLPLLIGLLSQCLSGIRAQQKVGSEFQVNTYTNNYQTWPSVARLSQGNFVVTWQSRGQDGSDYGIYGQIFNGTGAKIGSEFLVNTFTSSTQTQSSVASFSNGNFVVTWHSNTQDGSGYGIYGQIFNETGAKIGNEFRVNAYTGDQQQWPSVASLQTNNFVVTWHSNLQDGSKWGVYGQLFNSTGVKIGNEFRINTYTANNQYFPSVASLNSGNFIVVWESWEDGSGYGVFGQKFNGTGSAVGSEFQVNSYSFDYQYRPSVASFSNGNFVVTWISFWQDGDLSGIFGQLFNENGEKIGSEFQVNTEFIDRQEGSQVRSLYNDNFVVTWHSLNQDGSKWGVYGQLFNENGMKIGNEFQINSYTTNSQSEPFTICLQNNSFVVTWHSEGQDGSNHGVYGQIFHDNLTLSSSSGTSSSQTTLTTSSSITSSTSSSSLVSTHSTSEASTTNVTPKMTTDRIPVTSSITSKAPSPNRNKDSFFRGFFSGMLGGAVIVTIFGAIAVVYWRLRRQKKEDGVLELGEMGVSRTETLVGEFRGLPAASSEVSQTSQEEEYKRTPDFVRVTSNKAAPLEDSSSSREEEYGHTPDFIASSQTAATSNERARISDFAK